MFINEFKFTSNKLRLNILTFLNTLFSKNSKAFKKYLFRISLNLGTALKYKTLSYDNKMTQNTHFYEIYHFA